MRIEDLPTLIHDSEQAYFKALKANDITEVLNIELERAILGILQVLQLALNEHGEFKDDVVAAKDREEFVNKLTIFYNTMAPKLADLYGTSFIPLTEAAITNLTGICEIIANSKIATFSNILSTCINPAASKQKRVTITPTHLEELFAKMLHSENGGKGYLRKDRYTLPNYRLYPKPEEIKEQEKQKIMAVLRRDVETLHAMLDNHGLTKEDVSKLINKNWRTLIDCAPPEIISTIFAHPKAIEALKIKNQQIALQWIEARRTLQTPDCDRTVLDALVVRGRWDVAVNRSTEKLVPIPADQAGLALAKISKNRYFELTRGADELRESIEDLDSEIRRLSPWYSTILVHQEPDNTSLENYKFYVFTKEKKLHYKVKNYDGIISTGELRDCSGYPTIFYLPPLGSSERDRELHKKFITQTDTLYFYAIKNMDQFITVAWKDRDGGIHKEDLCCLSSDDNMSRVVYTSLHSKLQTITGITTVTDIDEKQLVFNLERLIRLPLSEFGTEQLVADLTEPQVTRSITRQEDEIIRRQAGLNRYRMKESDDHNSMIYPNLSVKIKCIATLRERLQHIEQMDKVIFDNLIDLVIPRLSALQVDSKIEQKCQLNVSECLKAIDTILTVSTDPHTEIHRCDIKLHRVVQALVDAHNAIEHGNTGRSSPGFFDKSKKEMTMEPLLEEIQGKLLKYPNYAFTIERIAGGKIEIKWTEEFKDDNPRLPITPGASETLPVKR